MSQTITTYTFSAEEKLSFFGNKDKLLIKDKSLNTVASFSYNMNGYVPNFELSNKDKVLFAFYERNANAQLTAFKKAVKSGYNIIKKYG